jgi:hypothetical protein
MSDIGWLILAAVTTVVAALLWMKRELWVMRRGRERRRGER